mmetsp:Transcript_18498/g.61977  ORF Transcript_18498/g.61977 Transcript_18498/m.61977 type:complete len:250 (+) Transcript_18498:331-1080(+)
MLAPGRGTRRSCSAHEWDLRPAPRRDKPFLLRRSPEQGHLLAAGLREEDGPPGHGVLGGDELAELLLELALDVHHVPLAAFALHHGGPAGELLAKGLGRVRELHPVVLQARDGRDELALVALRDCDHHGLGGLGRLAARARRAALAAVAGGLLGGARLFGRVVRLALEAQLGEQGHDLLFPFHVREDGGHVGHQLFSALREGGLELAVLHGQRAHCAGARRGSSGRMRVSACRRLPLRGHAGCGRAPAQ